MAHQDLTNASAADCSAIGSAPRTFTVYGGDNSTIVYFYKADVSLQSSGPALMDGSAPPPNRHQLVLRANQTRTFPNADTYIGFTFTGTAPSAVAVDGDASKSSTTDDTEM